MSRAIDVEKAIEIIETKQKELCPVGRYGRNYVYGSDREKYDAWDEIIDVLENLPTLTTPSEPLTCEGCIHEEKEHQNCNYCMRASYLGDYYYRRPPEGEANETK